MPIMDGYEATRAIRTAEGDGPRTAIVAMTSDTLDSVREACFAAGMDDHLAKPVTGEALAAAIERWRAGSRLAPAAPAASERRDEGPRPRRPAPDHGRDRRRARTRS